MFGESFRCVTLSSANSAKSRCKEITKYLLCGLAALAMISLFGRLAKADDFDWTTAKDSASAFLRVALGEKTASPSGGQNLQAEFEIFKNTQKQLLLNSLVLRTALKQPGIGELAIIKSQKNPVDWLSRNLQISFPGNAEIMQVSLSGKDPKELAKVVNAVVDAYIAEVIDAERVKRNDRINELKQIQVNKAQEVKDALSDLRKMADSLGTSDTETINIRQKNVLEELAAYRGELLRGQFELNRMKVELASQKALSEVVEHEEISDFECQMYPSTRDIFLEKLGAVLADLEIAADSKFQAKLESIQKKYQERLEVIRNEIRRKKMVEIEREIKKLEAAIALASKQQDVNQEELKQLRKESDRFGMSSIDMQMRRAATANAQKALDVITAEIDTLHIESLAAPRVTIVQKAEVPE